MQPAVALLLLLLLLLLVCLVQQLGVSVLQHAGAASRRSLAMRPPHNPLLPLLQLLQSLVLHAIVD